MFVESQNIIKGFAVQRQMERDMFILTICVGVPSHFVSQMNRPIQVKPADSEGRGGETQLKKKFHTSVIQREKLMSFSK